MMTSSARYTTWSPSLKLCGWPAVPTTISSVDSLTAEVKNSARFGPRYVTAWLLPKPWLASVTTSVVLLTADTASKVVAAASAAAALVASLTVRSSMTRTYTAWPKVSPPIVGEPSMVWP